VNFDSQTSENKKQICLIKAQNYLKHFQPLTTTLQKIDFYTKASLYLRTEHICRLTNNRTYTAVINQFMPNVPEKTNTHFDGK